MNPKAITFRTPNDYLKKILHPYSSTKIYFVHNKSKDHLSLYKIIANIRAVISSPYPNNWQQQKKTIEFQQRNCRRMVISHSPFIVHKHFSGLISDYTSRERQRERRERATSMYWFFAGCERAQSESVC